MTGRGINATGGEQHTVTDRGHGHPAGEGVDDQAVQRVAVDVGAHPAGAMAAGQQQRVNAVESGFSPTGRVLIFRGLQHVLICAARVLVGPQHSPHERDGAQHR